MVMRRIQEVLRLKAAGLSDKAISRSARIAWSTAKEYLERAVAGLSWEIASALSEEAVESRLFVADTRHVDRPMPD
jgi:DNA-binding NarL/FixJ family response regulator